MMNKEVLPIEGIIARLDNDFNIMTSDYIPRVAAWCIDAMNEMGTRMFGMHSNMPLTQQFAGYALVVPFLLQIVTGLLPDFRIIAWLLQFYIVYVVWEGAPIMMKVEEKQRLKYTLLSSVLLILCPTVIQFVFNKLTAILN